MVQFIDDRCLSNFVAIYEHGNLRRAAERVGLTQPAMSKSLARLEDDLEVLLFVRRNRGLAPTNAAHELYACAGRIETEVRRSLIRIASVDSSVRGQIRIGAGQMWSWTRLPSVIHEFIGEFPNLEISLVTAPMKRLIEQLENGQLDIVVGDMSDVTVPHDCVEHQFRAMLQWPYIRKGHPLSGRAEVALSELLAFPWIGFVNDDVFLTNIAAMCAPEQLPMPRMPLHTTSTAASMSLARAGDYVLVLPEVFEKPAAVFDLEPVRSHSLKTWVLETSAVCYKDEHLRDPMQRLISLMKEVVATS